MFPIFLLVQQSNPVPVQLEAIAIAGVYEQGRRPISKNAILEQLQNGTFANPKVGDKLKAPSGEESAWRKIQLNKDKVYEDSALEGGYAFAIYKSSKSSVKLLSPKGASVVYINGVPRAGDPYGFGYLQLPFLAKKGDNTFLMSCGRGFLNATVSDAPKPVYVETAGATLPDMVPGDSDLLGGVTLVNASEATLRGLSLVVGEQTMPVPTTGALTVRKAPFKFAITDIQNEKIKLKLVQNGKTLDTVELPIKSKTLVQSAVRTFQSKVDGSVQEYAVRPATNPSPNNALILSLHGASVVPISQANAYSSKSWATIVCPSNRGPYAFDWEDWGRLDAIEALHDASERYPHDAYRTHLTGHSMGGHGTWHIGTLFPDQFATVAPSAGWVSFMSYASGLKIDKPDDREKVLLGSMAVSDTLGRVTNLRDLGVYILHGDKDDNVPVTEARTMRDELLKFHSGFGYYEEPGAGHWWGHPDDSGASCVDWAPMFDQFARRRIPQMPEVRSIDFTTQAPNVSARDHWLRILQQVVPMAASRVQIKLDPASKTFRGTTNNVESLSLDIAGSLSTTEAIQVELDGVALKDLKPSEGRVILRKAAGKWTQVTSIPATEKNPLRGSDFKNALRKNWIIVYGTGGTDQEKAWNLAEARFLSETYTYRGNASPYVVSDKDINIEVSKQRDILLVGNSSTNSVWDVLMPDSPVKVSRDGIWVGNKQATKEGVALFCRPSQISIDTMVAALGVTSAKSCRVAESLPIFSSGVAYPDYAVFDSTVFSQGTKAVVSIGWFNNAWRLPN